MLDQKHRKEHAELQREMEEEKQRAINSLGEQTQRQMQSTIQKHEMEFQRQLAQKQSKLSVAETDQLISAHREEMAALQNTMELEREQQMKVSFTIVGYLSNSDTMITSCFSVQHSGSFRQGG